MDILGLVSSHYRLKVPLDCRVAAVGVRHIEATKTPAIGLQLISKAGTLIVGWNEGQVVNGNEMEVYD